MRQAPFPVNPDGKRQLWDKVKATGLDADIKALQAQFPDAKLVAIEVDGTRYGERAPTEAQTFDAAWHQRTFPPQFTPEQLERIRKDKLAHERRRSKRK